MPKVRRNETCPCGSGKKYKRCHGIEQAPANELLWRQVRSTRDSLVGQILEHAAKKFGQRAIHDAWGDWCLGDARLFDPDSQEVATFLPWFLYEWIPDEVLDLETMGEEIKDFPIAWSFRKKRGAYLLALEHRYLEQAEKEAFGFFEILEVSPGDGFKLREIFTDRVFEVSERMGSQDVTAGSFLYGKVVQLGEVAILDSCSDVMFPMEWKTLVLEYKEELRGLSDEPLDVDDLTANDENIRSLYLDLREMAINPEPPRLTNTDGEPLAFNKLIFDLDDPEAVFEKLHRLTLDEKKEMLLRDAKKDSDGKLLEVSFPWLKRGNRANSGLNNTILAHLTLERGRLVVEVNSVVRAKKARKKIEQLAGDLIRYRITLIEPLEAKLKEAESRSKSETKRPVSEHAELMKDPEIKAKMQEMMRRHLESWVDEKIPALGHRTPKQAVKTPEGREMVETLLKKFERTAATRDEDGFEMNLIQGLKRTLGLKIE